jgi:hypothetical protein
VALETLVAGRYTATYNSVDVGITTSGYLLEQTSAAENIDRTDAYGDSIIDLIYRGGNTYCEFECKGYKAGSLTPFWPWAAALGRMAATATPIGRLGSAVASAFVLTSTANTPAAAAPASLTCSTAILAPGYPTRLLYNSQHRVVPIRLLFLPYDSSGNTVWWTQT